MSAALYRLMLRLCSPDLRREFGAEMEALFLADLSRARGFGKAAVWLRACGDVVRHGLGARPAAVMGHPLTLVSVGGALLAVAMLAVTVPAPRHARRSGRGAAESVANQ